MTDIDSTDRGDAAPPPIQDDGGRPATDLPAPGQTPADLDTEAGTPGGTAAGNPLAGVLISEADAAEAVSGDTGPEHPGARRDGSTGGA